ncbi:META domain-containing protein [Gallaecimonas kandeliae]|uniref:META domain-containing protein n=1 Tax=Gallaecimonas kandeliae TaxID=3029055 RepID=UPI002648C6C2|nr:META domain-containing protein [Gallaecimonas kandeliae]WKE63984.1 META domain-containing protein [Gallaecimonas kandeliae]
MDKKFVMMAVLLLAGCQHPNDPGFYDATWYLSGATVEGPLKTAANATKGITLNLTSDGKLSGVSGCNRYFGGYKLVNGAAIKVGNIGSTKMACMGELMQAEGLYLDRLGKANWIELDGDTLKLYSDGFEAPLRFRQGR